MSRNDKRLVGLLLVAFLGFITMGADVRIFLKNTFLPLIEKGGIVGGAVGLAIDIALIGVFMFCAIEASEFCREFDEMKKK